jgi:hypothetical protein
LDLSRETDITALNGEVALTIVATKADGVFTPHPLQTPEPSGGEWRINPLYEVDIDSGRLVGRLRFPSADYEDEYGACRQYLPDEIVVESAELRALQEGARPDALAELIRRRVIVELPARYV